jgi:TolB-like protein
MDLPPPAPDSGAVKAQLERIARSDQFARSERLTRFLQFICATTIQGKADELKETVIGTSVFERAPDYDPKIDSIVRKEANRLRSRLDEYYRTMGLHDPVRVELPKGGYVPVFRFAAQSEPSVQVRRRSQAISVIAASSLLSISGAAFLFLRIPVKPDIYIAVLPFENQSGDSGQEYFATGLSTEIHHTLASVEHLRVIGWVSSSTFRGQGGKAREILNELHADYLLTGAVRRFGSRVSVRAELTRRDGMGVWSYGTGVIDEKDIFKAHEEISLSLVNSLRGKFGNLRRRYDASAEIYDEYWKARYWVDDFRAPHADRAIPLLHDILMKDPGYAPAYALLNHAYFNISSNRQMPPADAERQMYVAAQKALELDPLLPEAHSALGFALQRDYQWTEAERSFRRALELDPNNVQAFYGLGSAVYTKTGRFDEAERTLRQGIRLDPRSSQLNTALRVNLLNSGHCYEAVGLDKNHSDKIGSLAEPQRESLALCLCGTGRLHEGLNILNPDRPSPARCFALGRLDRKDEARAELDRLRASFGDLFSEYMYHAGIQDASYMIDALEREYRAKDPILPLHLNWPTLAFLHGDSRYRDLRRRTGLADIR